MIRTSWQEKWELIVAVVKQRAQHHDNYCWSFDTGISWRERKDEYGMRYQPFRFVSYRWIARHWYSAKTIICIMLDRENPTHSHLDMVDTIAMLNYHKGWNFEYGEAADWDVLSVGHGVFRRWYYDYYSDGYP